MNYDCPKSGPSGGFFTLSYSPRTNCFDICEESEAIGRNSAMFLRGKPVDLAPIYRGSEQACYEAMAGAIELLNKKQKGA